MRIDILTLFPEMFTALNESIIGRAVKSGKVEIVVTDIRDFALDKHRRCDDYTFGGGAGMVLMPEPVGRGIETLDPDHAARRIYMSPKGKTFTQKDVATLLNNDRLLFLCGHYEGIDQRIIDLFIDEEMSIGDYILTGGELPAMVITDAICRYVDGVISKDSLKDETFTNRLVEYPQYTRPQEYRGLRVPDVLISGNHAEVDKWRLEQSVILTKKLRPDLLKDDEQ